MRPRLVFCILAGLSILKATTCLSYEHTTSIDSDKDFWENLYQNSLLNTRNKFSVLNGERVCFTCPIDRGTFTRLYQESIGSFSNQEQQLPPRVTISWIAQLNGNRVIPFCSNNTRRVPNPLQLSSNGLNSNEAGISTLIEFSCESNRLCLHNVKNSYPSNYQCLIKSYALDVKLDVIVQLTHVLLYFTGDSVKFDYQKEVQVHENQPFTVKCEVPESNPVSIVKAYIDEQELKLTGLEKKTVENRMTINTYSFQVNATRNMNGKKVKCDAQMKDIPPELANSIDLRSHLFKDYMISVYYPPSCVYKQRVYRTGINRSIVIECPINSSNPDVTYYKMIPPSTRTKFELIDNNIDTLKRIGRYRINPLSRADFGLYECIPRSLAGMAKCDIIVELGSTPNPPEMCNVQFARVNNKTFAQFSCKPGHNQGGSTSFLSIYEIIDQKLKLSGRVNIDESKMDKEVPYISPADEDKYYEFLIMQENNYGNSTSILLTLGTPKDAKKMTSLNIKNFYMIGGGIAAAILIFCICGCCCCSDVCGSAKSDNAFCKCCSTNEHDEDAATYKKAPLDSDILAPRNYQPYSSDSLKYGYNHHSNYDYYDNTTTGLLGEPTNYERFGTIKSKKMPIVNSSSYDTNHSDMYEHDYEENEYMNEKNDSDTSKEEKDYAAKITKSKNASEMFNNNVSVSIGSGVESIKKHTSNLGGEIYGRKIKLSSDGTSTVDRKNLIKTDNGLVYTPLDGKEDDIEYDNCDDAKYRDIKYSSIKRTNSIHNKQLVNSNFQAELSQKLKTINKNDEIYSKNLKVKNLPSANSFNQSEQLTNSTATTSVSSSASSCASNSDLIIKSNTLKRPLPPTPIETKNYSLLKTTISLANSENSTPAKTKPPILKPKPRTNSAHNQSVEPLINAKSDSPNTSVTDVSSNNCTPQHYNQNLMEEIGQVNSLLKNNLSKKVNPNAIYSTIKLNCDYSNNVTPNLKTFSPNYENRKKSPTSIDDEIKLINSRGTLSKTIERRHVKNSEC